MNSDLQSKCIYVSCFLGATANGLLLYFIFTDKSRPSNGYQRILAIITFYNIYYNLVHCVTDMGFVIEKDGFVMFSKQLHQYGWWASFLATLIYVDAYTMSISLLLIHGLYRYCTITGRWSHLFQEWKFLFVITVAHFSFGIFWCSALMYSMNPTLERSDQSRARLFAMYNVSIDDLGYMGPIYMLSSPNGNSQILWNNVLGTLFCFSVLMILYTSICVLGIRLILFIRSSIISEKAKKMNYQLMRLFTIQAVVPLFFEYVPCFLNVAAGPLTLIGFPFYEDLGYYIPIFVSFYPLMDSTMVFLGFKDYRNRILASRLFQTAKMLKGSKIFASASENPNQT